MARSRANRRATTVFSLSFLDAMTCGFGAIVLLYMVINATVSRRTDTMTGQLQAEAEQLDVEVLEGQRRLVELRNSLRDVEHRNVIAQGLSTRLIENLEALEIELATYENTTLSQKQHLNKLMADLKSLEPSAAGPAAPGCGGPGVRVRRSVWAGRSRRGSSRDAPGIRREEESCRFPR